MRTTITDRNAGYDGLKLGEANSSLSLWQIPQCPLHPGQIGMGQARFIECGEILQSDFAKGFSMQRFVPVLAVNGERLFVMALEKQGVGEVALDEDQVVAVTFLDPVADLISQTLSLFAPCLGLRELAAQDQLEGKIAERRRQPVT